MKLLVTGAAGFIGSTYVRIAGAEHEVVVLDKLTYAGRRENLPEGTALIEGAIEDPAVVREAMEGVDAVVNFAAESHVDRSIDDQQAFARTHVIGTGTLLDAARELGIQRYVQVSTDEVYGSIDSGSFTETSPLDPDLADGVEQGAGADHVGAGEGVLVVDRAVDVGLGGEVDHRVDARHRLADDLRVLDRALDQLGPLGRVLRPAGVGQFVEDEDLVLGPGDADVGRADESGGAGDEQLHLVPFRLSSSRPRAERGTRPAHRARRAAGSRARAGSA